MANPSGILTQAAVRRPDEDSEYSDLATFGTNQLPLLTENLKSTPVFDKEEANAGAAGVQDGEIVAWRVDGPMSYELWYESLEPLFLAGMGFECPTVYTGAHGTGSGGSPAPDVASPSDEAYFHVFELDEQLHRSGWLSGERAASTGLSTAPTYWDSSDQKVRSVDLGIYKTEPAAAVHGYHGMMVKKFTIRATLDRCTVDFEFIGRRHKQDALLNYGSWALPVSRARVVFPSLRFFCTAVGSTIGTEYAVKELTVVCDNGLEGEFVSGTDSEYTIEPIRTGTRKVTGQLKIARYDSSQWFTWRDNETDVQMLFNFTSGQQISGSSKYYNMNVALPRVRVTEASYPIGGPGVIMGDISFEAWKPASEQAWLTSILGGISQVKLNEMLLTIWNKNPACYSRDRQASGVTLP